MEELIAIVSVGAALAALIIAQSRSLRRDFSARMDRMEAQIAELRNNGKAQIVELRDRTEAQTSELREHIDSQIGELREHIDSQISELRTLIGDLRERMARLEGLFEGFARRGSPGPEATS